MTPSSIPVQTKAISGDVGLGPCDRSSLGKAGGGGRWEKLPGSPPTHITDPRHVVLPFWSPCFFIAKRGRHSCAK